MNRLRTDKKNTTATPDSLRIPYGGELALSAETRECLGIQGVALGFIDTVPSEAFVTHAERAYHLDRALSHLSQAHMRDGRLRGGKAPYPAQTAENALVHTQLADEHIARAAGLHYLVANGTLTARDLRAESAPTRIAMKRQFNGPDKKPQRNNFHTLLALQQKTGKDEISAQRADVRQK